MPKPYPTTLSPVFLFEFFLGVGKKTLDPLLVIYASLVRSVLEYCCPVWHNNLPQYLSDLVERVQKRAFRIILPNTTYSEALAELKSMSLSERRDELYKKIIRKIVKGTFFLSHLLPTTRVCAHGRDLRNGNNSSSYVSSYLCLLDDVKLMSR